VDTLIWMGRIGSNATLFKTNLKGGQERPPRKTL